jgi:hypothetical protein
MVIQDNKQFKNLAFVDGQNLYMGTAKRKVPHGKLTLLDFAPI